MYIPRCTRSRPLRPILGRLPLAAVGVKAVGVSALERLRRTAPWRVDAVLATFLVLIGLTTTNRAEPVYEPRD